MREKCKVPPLCYDFSQETAFLNNEDNKKALGAEGEWQSCNFQVNAEFQTDFVKGYQQFVPDQLEAGINVLIYAGDVDFICNWLGNQAWTLGLEWSGKEGFNKAAANGWTADGKEAGKLRTYKNFNFLQVYQAGHMVPLDQPAVALEMFNKFLTNELTASEGVLYA